MDTSSLNSAIESILHSLNTSPSPSPHQSLISQVLLALLTPQEYVPADISNKLPTVRTSSAEIPSNRETPINHLTNELFTLSDSSLQYLLEATLRPGPDILSEPALSLVCRRLGMRNSLVIPTFSKWSALKWSSQEQSWYSKGRDCGSRNVSGEHLKNIPEERRENEFMKQLDILAGQIADKGTCQSSILRVCDHLLHSQTSASWLPNELLHQLLDRSVSGQVSLTQCQLIACLLLYLPHRTLDYFSTLCIPQLCSSITSTGSSDVVGVQVRGECSLEAALFLLSVYLTVIAQKNKKGVHYMYVCIHSPSHRIYYTVHLSINKIMCTYICMYMHRCCYALIGTLYTV